jgi:hypothetical protein
MKQDSEGGQIIILKVWFLKLEGSSIEVYLTTNTKTRRADQKKTKYNHKRNKVAVVTKMGNRVYHRYCQWWQQKW